MSSRVCLALAALLGFLAVGMGAFGAHFLSDGGHLVRQHADVPARTVAGMEMPASWKYLQDFQTGVHYHMWHALALMGIGVWKRNGACWSLTLAAWALIVGIVLFSGSLYVIAIAGSRFAGIPWGMVAPAGGTLLLVGWLCTFFAACRSGNIT